MSTKEYLIWSNEHGAWWRPNSCGYTNSGSGAGLYTKEEAERICKSHGDSTCADEEMRPAADYVDELMSPDWKAYLKPEKDLSDGEVITLWVDSGGTFHGPVNETAHETEKRIIAFIRSLL